MCAGADACFPNSIWGKNKSYVRIKALANETDGRLLLIKRLRADSHVSTVSAQNDGITGGWWKVHRSSEWRTKFWNLNTLLHCWMLAGMWHFTRRTDCSSNSRNPDWTTDFNPPYPHCRLQIISGKSHNISISYCIQALYITYKQCLAYKHYLPHANRSNSFAWIWEQAMFILKLIAGNCFC